MAALTNTTPQGISQFRNTLRATRYLNPDNKPQQAGILIEADQDNPALWDAWPVYSGTWVDVTEVETQGRTRSASEWAHLTWAR